jgi:eukaryotic-like serine/threonine-protein kinase
MNLSRTVVFLASFGAVTVMNAQSMFRGDATHSGTYTGPAPRQFHRVKWKFPTGDRVISSPVFKDNVIYFGGDDGNVYAVDVASGRQIWKRATNGPVPATPAIADGTVYTGSYDGKFYALNAKTGAVKWKFATDGERRFEAKGLHGWQPKSQAIADPFDIFLSSPVVANGSVYFGSGDGNLYALDSATGDLRWKFKTGDVVHASPALADGVLFFGSWDSYFYAVDASTGREKWRFHGGEDPLIRRRDHPAQIVKDSPLLFSCRGIKRSSLYHVIDANTGKPLVRQQGRAYMFSSPAVAGDVVFIGVLNGTLEARDAKTGDLLWDFQVDKSKQNKGWVLTADRKFNVPRLFHSNWREAPLVANDRQIRIGGIFSSPLVVNGVVYFGSADGFLYALE